MKTLKIIGNCCLVFLAVIAVCVSLGFCYYHFFVKDIVIGVNNIADQNGLDIVKEEDLTEEERIIRSERDARLWTAIDHLPTERKKIFLLSKRDGLTYQEIATELGISIKTVEHQISKALKTLRETAIKIYTFFFG